MPKTTSAPSFEKIHYVLRPAKNAERRMMCTLLRRLDPPLNPRLARYIGMGSVFFADLSLFHRELEIDDMVNIEVEESAADKARFHFNAPFFGIDLRHGDSAVVLSDLDWDKPTIVWLDYDAPLRLDQVQALRNVIDLCQPPAFLAVTVQANPDPQGQRIKALQDRLQDEKLIPIQTTDASLSAKGITGVYRNILTAAVDGIIEARRARSGAANQIGRQQVLNLRYADGASMYTLAWLIHSDAEAAAVDKLDLSDLWFVSKDEVEQTIFVPPLTHREILHLNQQLPQEIPEPSPGLSDRFVDAYRKLYRHYPNFFEIEV